MRITAINSNYTNSLKINNLKLKQNSNNCKYTSYPISFNGELFPQKSIIIKSISEQVQEMAKTIGEKLHKTDIENIANIFRKIQGAGGKNKSKSLTLEEIVNIYVQKLQKAKISLLGNGKEQGLNKIAGLTDLKAKMYNDFLIPLCEVLDGKPKHMFVPDGIGFIGPKGSGKTTFARALGEHYAQKGGNFEEIKLTGNKDVDIDYLKLKFEEAEERFEQSGNKKYTIFLFDEVEKMLDSKNPDQRPIIGTLLKETACCKDRGVIFMSTVNDYDKLEPAIYRMGRTDKVVPLGKVEDYDVPDMIDYFIKKNKLPIQDKIIDFEKISEAIKQQKLQYNAGDIETRLISAVSEANKQMDTNGIIHALTKDGPNFTEEQSNALKEFDHFIDMYND